MCVCMYIYVYMYVCITKSMKFTSIAGKKSHVPLNQIAVTTVLKK